MRHNDIQGAPIEDFDTTDLPGMGPGGLAGGHHDRKLPPDPPRLCEAGPCRNYHRFAVQLDVEGPKASGVGEGGKLIGPTPDQPFYVRIHHYCYPTVGIETDLGSLPVMRCNRWDPIDADESGALEAKRARFLETEAGREHLDALARWKEHQAEQADAADDELASWVTMNLRDGDELEVLRSSANGGSGAEPDRLGKLDADSARAIVTTAWLRQSYGSGPYRFWILRRIEDEVVRAGTFKLEV